uniref:Ovule protein n=1 Tax=Rodentolepis nana TaxID=102285 RepID=A0A0R3TDN8_RODNA
LPTRPLSRRNIFQMKRRRKEVPNVLMRLSRRWMTKKKKKKKRRRKNPVQKKLPIGIRLMLMRINRSWNDFHCPLIYIQWLSMMLVYIFSKTAISSIRPMELNPYQIPKNDLLHRR